MATADDDNDDDNDDDDDDDGRKAARIWGWKFHRSFNRTSIIFQWLLDEFPGEFIKFPLKS